MGQIVKRIKESEEFGSRSTLGKITFLESIQADLGALINRVKNQYLDEESELKEGDLVYFRKFEDEKIEKCGKISRILFDISPIGFTYLIEPLNKGFKTPNRKLGFVRIPENRYKDQMVIKAI